MTDRRHINSYLALFVAFAAGLVISGLFLQTRPLSYPNPLFLSSFADFDNWSFDGWLSKVTAIVLLLATAGATVRTARRFSSGFCHFAPVFFMIVTAANPYSLMVSPFHPAALLFIASIYYFFHFITIDHNISQLFVSNLFLDLAVCFCPSLIWIAPFMMVMGLNLIEYKIKYIISHILSLILPFVIMASVLYLRSGLDEAVTIFPQLAREATNTGFSHISVTLPAICRMLSVAVFAVAGATVTIRNANRFKIAKYEVYVRLMLLMVILTATAAIFAGNTQYPWSILTAIPLSILCNEIFNIENSVKDKQAWTVMIMMMLIMTVERITYFIK